MKTPEEMASHNAAVSESPRELWDQMARDFAHFAGREDSIDLATRYKTALASILGTIPPAP